MGKIGHGKGRSRGGAQGHVLPKVHANVEVEGLEQGGMGNNRSRKGWNKVEGVTIGVEGLEQGGMCNN